MVDQTPEESQMSVRPRLLPLSLLVAAFATMLPGQEAAPSPAPELKKLASLVGSWHGEGKATFGPGAPASEWHATGTYRWCLDGHFLREDFEIHFADMPMPLAFRAYLGWDGENQRYVNATINNGGEARLQEMALLPDGTLVQLMMQSQEGLPYAERSRIKVDGDTMRHTIDLFMPEGGSMQVVDGTFQRGGETFDGNFDVATWQGATPVEAMQKLGRSAGTYATKGEMVMMPGQPTMHITGTDTFRTVFGGLVLRGHSDGAAEGFPGEYHSEVFWAWDAPRHRFNGVFLSNMGEVGQMDGWLTTDGTQLISNTVTTMQGQPVVQNFVMTFGADGATTAARGWSIFGGGEPFANFKATYEKKAAGPATEERR